MPVGRLVWLNEKKAVATGWGTIRGLRCRRAGLKGLFGAKLDSSTHAQRSTSGAVTRNDRADIIQCRD